MYNGLRKKDINYLLGTKRKMGNYQKKSITWVIMVSFPILTTASMVIIYLFLRISIFHYQSEYNNAQEYLNKEENISANQEVENLQKETQYLLDFKAAYMSCKKSGTADHNLNRSFFSKLVMAFSNDILVSNFAYSGNVLSFSAAVIDYMSTVTIVERLGKIEEIVNVNYYGFQLTESGYEFEIECMLQPGNLNGED